MEWSMVPLRGILLEAGSGTWGSEPESSKPVFPVLRSTNIQNGRLVLTDPAYRSVSPKTAKKYHLLSGDILVTTSSGSQKLIGKNALVEELPGHFLFSNFTWRLRPDSGTVVPKYLFYYLNSSRAQAELNRIQSTTSGLRNLNTKLYLEQEIPLPPLSEQRRIVEILDQADRLRRLRAQADAIADRILPALFIKMFGDPATNPMGWPKPRLGALCKIIRGASPRPKGDPRYFGGPIPWITITDVHRAGRILRNCKEGVTEEGAKRSVLLRSGTLILSNSASVGTPCILGVEGCIHDGFLAFLDIQPSLRRDFLYALFLLEREHLRALAPAGTQANLNTSLLKNFPVMLPPTDLQDRFVALSLFFEEKIRADLKGAQQSVERTWNVLMTRAFSGSLTASWREAHMKELLQEMEQQARLLEGTSL